MSPFLSAVFFLHLSSLATTANLTLVYEWHDEMDYEWPSEASRTQALRDRTFEPDEIEPIYMAVYGSRLFLSLYRIYAGIPVSLVSLPTSSASSAPPKLTPFPSWDMHSMRNCNMIEYATGLQVDSVGRLWVLDGGSSHCNSKIWMIDLINNDQTKLIQQFPENYLMHDLVLDETPNGTFAYFSWWEEEHIGVFSLERNKSWTVETPRIKVYSIALSPKNNQEPRQLYRSKWESKELYSIPVAALRSGARTAEPELIGNWTAGQSYRMLMDNHGTMYAAFLGKNYIRSWNGSQPFEEQRFHEVAGLRSEWPFTFALDENGTFWMTEFNEENKPRYRLLKATLEGKSSEALPVTPAIPTTTTKPSTPAEETSATTDAGEQNPDRSSAV
ncbi:protein yellow-like [Cloeon dipterum]|uniref:protein yellow-like n=1 Tax=Cloeon dipterum TaxID=197152 RepID=UPI0032208B16